MQEMEERCSIEQKKMAAQRAVARLRGRVSYDPWARAALAALTRYRGREADGGARAEAARALREALEPGEATASDVLAWGQP